MSLLLFKKDYLRDNPFFTEHGILMVSIAGVLHLLLWFLLFHLIVIIIQLAVINQRQKNSRNDCR